MKHSLCEALQQQLDCGSLTLELPSIPIGDSPKRSPGKPPRILTQYCEALLSRVHPCIEPFF